MVELNKIQLAAHRPDCAPVAFSVVVDPSAANTANLNKVIFPDDDDSIENHLGVSLGIDRIVPTNETGPIASDGTANGLFYRPLSPFQFQISLLGTSKETEFSAMLLAPDPVKRRVLYVERHAFVDVSMNMSFVDGTLVGTDINKPSEVLAGIELPLEVIERLLQVPGAVVKGAIPQSSTPAKGAGGN
jgi:hypothetical protein